VGLESILCKWYTIKFVVVFCHSLLALECEWERQFAPFDFNFTIRWVMFKWNFYLRGPEIGAFKCYSHESCWIFQFIYADFNCPLSAFLNGESLFRFHKQPLSLFQILRMIYFIYIERHCFELALNMNKQQIVHVLVSCSAYE
jgi:hypothetical protein